MVAMLVRSRCVFEARGEYFALDLAGLDTSSMVRRIGSHLPGAPKTVSDLGSTVAGIGGATARSTGLVTAREAATAYWSNGGRVGPLSPGQAAVSAGVNTVVSGAFAYSAYQAGVAVGSAA
jgi:hypothetical protein